MSSTVDRAVPPLIKGGAVRELVLWYEAGHGRRYQEGVWRRLSAEHAALLAPDRFALGLLPSTWYPAEIVHALLDSFAELHGPDEMRVLLRDGNAQVVRRMSRGIYQYLFKLVGSPGLYARHIQKAWNALHNTGVRQVVIERPGYAISTIEGWRGHHPWLCEVTTETMRAVFEAVGCTDIVIERVRCVSDGSTKCEAFVRYREL
jgi:hypothetical protein